MSRTNAVDSGERSVIEPSSYRNPPVAREALPEHRNCLIERHICSAKNWASQRFSHALRHLARECTRYAHCYPQVLWTTLSDKA